MSIPPRLKCEYTELRTPWDVVLAVRAIFDGEICLDPYSSPDKWTQATNHIHKPKIVSGKHPGGHDHPWTDRTYANPPYGQDIPRAVHKAHEESLHGHRIALLLPCGARFSTAYFQTYVLSSRLTSICFFSYRLKFLDELDRVRTIMYDSAMYFYNVRAANVHEHLREHGKILDCGVL